MHDIEKRGPHVVGLVTHLCVSESQRNQARPDVGVITEPIPRLLSRGAVVSKTIGLNNESQRRPVEIDFEPIDQALLLGRWEPGLPCDWQKVALELD
jgi:hypothetical protein